MKIFTTLLVLILLATSVTWYMSQPVFDEHLDPATFNTVEVAPLNKALTFARTTTGNVILVVSADASIVKGINLSTTTDRFYDDAIDAYHSIDSDMLSKLITEQAQSEFAWGDLTTPINEHFPHVAAGTNYKAHAEEVGHEGEPFLFPKLSNITPWNADVINHGRMDYEVEICVTPITNHTASSPAKLGYLLCGDFTDRWALVTNIDTSGVMGQTGFPMAKGGDTRLPVGAFFLVPQKPGLYKELDLELYVNDELRQKSNSDLMIWSPAGIISRTLADCKSPYTTEQSTINISDCDVIPARTLFLTGTPEGVLFKIPTVWNPLAYLRNEDIVISKGRYLGYMQNKITNKEIR